MVKGGRKRKPQGNDSESDQYDDEISTFHKDREKILLESDHGQSDDSEQEQEVYPLVSDDDSSSDDEEILGYKQQLRQLRRNKFKKKMDSDMEEDEEEKEELPDSRAWGSKRSWFMGGDVRDNRFGMYGSDDETAAGAAVLEEKAAIETQKRHAALMSEEDFMIPPSSRKHSQEDREKGQKRQNKVSENGESQMQGLVQKGKNELETVETDLSKLSKKERQEIMKKLHPEYIPLLTDFNAKVHELQERILPLMRLVKEKKIDGLGADYIRLKYHIISNYLTNGAFYMYLMAKRARGVHDHPIIKRLVQFQNLYKRLLPVDRKVKKDVDSVLERVSHREDVGVIISRENSQQISHEKRKHKMNHDLGVLQKKRKTLIREETERVAGSNDDERNGEKLAANGGSGEADDEAERRAITYQMEKNKGLTAHKKKEARNPRVKHRQKFRRAKIRRKGQVQDYKAHKNLYTGEVTGLRAGIIRSRKLK